MAKKSKIARNNQRREIVERYAARRAELKELIRKPTTPVGGIPIAQSYRTGITRQAL